METPVRVALAVGGGYVLGRTKKMKFALTLGSMIAGRKLSSSALLSQGLDVLKSSPEYDKLREQLTGAGRAAAMSAATASLGRLSERIESGGRQEQDDDGQDSAEQDSAGQDSDEQQGDKRAQDAEDTDDEEGADDSADSDDVAEGEDEDEVGDADDSADDSADDAEMDDESDDSLPSRGSSGRGGRRSPEGRPARGTSRPRGKGEGSGSGGGRAASGSGNRRAGAGTSRGGNRG